jgi:uncharacterized tellurite resistance protein B-like protein
VTSARDFAALGRSELAAALDAGHPIDPDALADQVYRGVSLGLPELVDRLAWKTFAKAFHRDPQRGVLRGWNLRLEQQGVTGPIVPKQRRGHDFHFGHFVVKPAADYAMLRPLEHALLLDYGLGGNARLDVVRFIRDPIVAVDAGDARLLLGWTYLDVAGLRLPTPSYFTLERVGPLDQAFAPPRLGFGSRPQEPAAASALSAAVHAHLAHLPRERAELVAAFAGLLMRVAHADQEVSAAEDTALRRLVREHAGLGASESEAVATLVTSHAQGIAGIDYALLTRAMNEHASPDDKLHLVECLYAIATADDLVSVVEDDQIAAVGRALMVTRGSMLEIRARHRERLEVVQAARRLQER